MKKKFIQGKLVLLSGFIVLVAVLFLNYSDFKFAKGAEVVPSLLTPDYLGAEANSAQAKIRGPQLKVIFDKISMRTGDSVSATALPERFSVKNDELYYTWYIKRENGKDLDGDGDYDENDWKIEAMRIIAKNNYEKQDGDYSKSTDSDGAKAFPRWDKDGDGTKDADKYCYVQEYSTGRIYELTKVKSVFSKDLRSADGLFTNSNLCTQDPRCVTTKIQIDCSLQDPDNPVKSACIETGATASCKSSSTADIENFRASVSCEAKCGEGYFGAGSSNDQICSGLGLSSDGSCGNTSGTVNSCSFKKDSSGNFCKHLFPQPKGTGEETGDGSFGLKEEEFWSTDPNNNSTAGNGKLDEENIMGLGGNVFKWIYNNGDQVGVVVEGPSVIPTSHNSSDYMRMWAFSKNKCDEVEEADKKFYLETIFGSQKGILTVEDIDLNDCLEENLIDPSGGNIGTLNMGLAFDPQNPLNDPDSSATFSRGDVVRISATINEAVNKSDFYYKWTIEASGDNTATPANDLWKDITSSFSSKSYTEGIGLSKINFRLDLSNSDLRNIFGSSNSDAYYIRVKANVAEGTDSKTDSKSGKGSVIIKFSNIGDEIVPYKVNVSGGKLGLASPICNISSEERSVCYVLENEIIGITIPDIDGNLSQFKWKLNGVDLTCNSSMSSDCSNSGFTDTTFFPVTGSVGDVLEVTAEVKENETGLTKQIKRLFKIIEPAVVIKTKNEQIAWNKKLGLFKNTDGSILQDVSTKIFQTSSNETASFVAYFYPTWISSDASIRWSVNGSVRDQNNDDENLDLYIDQPAGSIYNLDVKASYLNSNEIRKALADYWGISQSNSGEKDLAYSAQIEVMQNEFIAISPFKNPKLFMANLFSNLPEKAMFLVKLAITVIMLLLVIGIIFSVMPDFVKKDE